MAVTVEQLAEYLRLPPDNAEELRPYLAAAVSQARTAGVREFGHNHRYDMFIKALAADLFDHRGLDPGSSARQAMINTAVLELRYAEEDDLDE